MPYGGFDPAKAKIVGIFFEPGARKPNRLGAALFGEGVDDSSAGITKAHHFRDLIVRITRSIIASPAQMEIFADVVDSIQERMAARSQQCDGRKRHLVLQLDSAQRSFQMIASDVRNSRTKRNAFDERQSHEQRAD